MTDSYPSEDDVDLGEVFKGALTTAEFNHRNNPGAAEFHSMPYDQQVDHFNDRIVPIYQEHGLPIPGRGRWINFQDSLKDMWRGKQAAIVRSADASQAKATGGMVALYPRTDIAEQLLVPGGEPLEEIHCTVVYLGQDVTAEDPTELIDFLHQMPQGGPIDANIFGSAIFNSTGEDPCVVYLVGGSPHLTPLFASLKGFVEQRYPGAAEQHDPWVPHITAAYGAGVGMSYEGPIVFDRLGLRWPGADQDFPL